MNDFEQQTLFSGLETGASLPPLAERMRPRTLDEFVGQERLLGPGRLLRRAIEADRLQSSIFWGPARLRKDHAGVHHRPHDGQRL